MSLSLKLQLQKPCFFLIVVMLVLSETAQSSQDKEKYYDSGALQFQYSYRNGKLHGTTKEYYETGELKTEHLYRAGKLIAQDRFRRDGKLEYELKYKHNKKYETQINYYQTGEKFRERILVNGKREGLEFEYYRTGQKKAERNYIKGKKEGIARGYHYNGKLQGDWLFKNDEPVSAVIFYSTGQKWLVHTDFDEKGRLNGTSKEFDKDGHLMAIRYYTNDEMVKRTKIRPWLLWWYWLFD